METIRTIRASVVPPLDATTAQTASHKYSKVAKK